MAQMHLSHSFAAMIKPQSCTRQCAAARPDFRSVRRAVQQAPHNLTVGTASTRAPTLLRAVRADQQTDTVDSAMLQTISQITQKVDEQFSATVASAQEAAKAVDASSDSELRQKVVTAVEKLQKGLLERETEVRLLLLASLCGEHLLLLGPPGTAKSELARRLSGLAHGAYFERLLTRFSVPEELFGPLSMQGLEQDRYIRKTEGYLPTAEVAFVDEIFKANR